MSRGANELQQLLLQGQTRTRSEATWRTRMADRLPWLAQHIGMEGERDQANSSARRQGEVSSSTNGNSQQTPSSTSAGNVCESIGMELENIPRREGQEILENREWRRDPQPSTTPPPAAETQAGDDVAHAELQLQALGPWLECNLIFFLLLINIFVSQHVIGVAIFASISIAVFGLNKFIRHQIRLKDAKQNFLLVAVAFYCLAHACTILLPLRQPLPWKTFLFITSDAPDASYSSVWQCFYDAIIMDGLVRFATITAKIFMYALIDISPQNNCPQLLIITCSKSSPEDHYQHRSRVLNATEHVSICCRVIATIPPWFCYLQTVAGYKNLFYAFFYLGIRTKLIAAKASQARKACRACCRCAGSPYGKYVEAETLVEDGQAASCAICQEAMTKPLQLACDHTFCEACITEWLEREPTCPMCRSKVKAPNMMYKDGSVSLLPQLF